MNRATTLSGASRSSRLEFALDRNAAWIDTLLVAIITAASLFNLVLVSLTPVLILAAMGAYVVLRWDRLHLLLRDGWPILLLPLFALLSATWSAMPGTAAYYATLYLVTIIAALMLGRGMKEGSLLDGYFLGFAMFLIFSVLSYRWTGWEGGTAFIGLAQSKNSMGDMSGVGLIATICFFFSRLSKRQLIPALFALALVPLYLFTLWYSRATGALIATVLISGCTLAWIASRSLPAQVRALIFLVAVLLIAALAATQSVWLPPLFNAVLQETGKDPGLTGRAELWIYADRLISERPWLGLGYNSFWVHNNLDAEFLWRSMGIESRMGFNFHNTYREILVHLGIVGLALFGIVAIIGAIRLLVITNRNPGHERIFACAMVVFYAIKMPFEVVGVSTIHFATITIMAMLAMGYRRASASET